MFREIFKQPLFINLNKFSKSFVTPKMRVKMRERFLGKPDLYGAPQRVFNLFERTQRKKSKVQLIPMAKFKKQKSKMRII